MKRKYKKKAELGLNEALLNKDSYNATIANSKNIVAENQAKQQGIEDSLISAGSKLGVGPLGKVSNFTTGIGNSLTQSAVKPSGDIQRGKYTAGKSIKYAGAGVSMGSFDPTGTTSAILGTAGAITGATVGAIESGKMERRYKNLKKTQDNVDNQFRIGSTVDDKMQANQAKEGKNKLLLNKKWKKKK